MDREEIIRRITVSRTRANLSARALSQMADLNDGYISRLESKKDFLPSMDSFLEIISACKVSPEEFFYYDMDMYAKDKQIIEMLKICSREKKDIVLAILKLC